MQQVQRKQIYSIGKNVMHKDSNAEYHSGNYREQEHTFDFPVKQVAECDDSAEAEGCAIHQPDKYN